MRHKFKLQTREVRLVNESLKWMAFTSNEYELAENPGSWNVWKYVGMKKDTLCQNCADGKRFFVK